MAAEQGLVHNSRLILNRCALTVKQRERVKEGESVEDVVQNEDMPEATTPEPDAE